MKKREEGYILGQVVIAIALISAILMSATSMYINLNKNTSLEEERIQAMVLAYNKWQEISSASYDKVESEARKVSQLEPFEIETSVGAETTLPSGDKSKTVTVSVFKGSNLNPSFSLPAEKLSSQGSGGLGYPDWAKSYTIQTYHSGGYSKPDIYKTIIIPSDGYVFINASSYTIPGANSNYSAKTYVPVLHINNKSSVLEGTILIPVKKGDVISITGAHSTLLFIPSK